MARLHTSTGDPRERLSGRGRVLVAEDDPINREVLSELLTQLGCDFTVVENGAEAVRAVAQNDFSAVLMDCQMPELDGLEATRRIRAAERGRRVPIVAMTATLFDEEREKMRAAGMDDCLTKPIELARLAAALDHAAR